tara:strand:+ start:351 stop:458 length:108 start_codon:yes stop_codon:yes gene_type:complete
MKQEKETFNYIKHILKILGFRDIILSEINLERWLK